MERWGFAVVLIRWNVDLKSGASHFFLSFNCWIFSLQLLSRS